MMEEYNIIEVVNKIGIYADNCDWEKVQTCFCEEVILDYSTMPDGGIMTMSPKEAIEFWQLQLIGFDKTKHYITNHQVRISDCGYEADTFSSLHAVQYLEGYESLHIYGTYNHHLRKTAGIWKIDHHKFNFEFMEGNTMLQEIAERKIAE
jgi:hypothetical protein